MFVLNGHNVSVPQDEYVPEICCTTFKYICAETVQASTQERSRKCTMETVKEICFGVQSDLQEKFSTL